MATEKCEGCDKIVDTGDLTLVDDWLLCDDCVICWNYEVDE